MSSPEAQEGESDGPVNTGVSPHDGEASGARGDLLLALSALFIFRAPPLSLGSRFISRDPAWQA